MPNKTIYVSEEDILLFEQAKALSGDNLSATIARALQYYIKQNPQQKGFQKVTLKVGKISYALKRFEGRLLAKAVTPSQTDRPGEAFEVYETIKGNFVLYQTIPPTWSAFPNPDGSWLNGQTEYKLNVYNDISYFEALIPTELADIVKNSINNHEIEDLDI